MENFYEASIKELEGFSYVPCLLAEDSDLSFAFSVLSREALEHSKMLCLNFEGLMNIAFAKILSTFNKEKLISLAMENEEVAIFILGEFYKNRKGTKEQQLEEELESSFFSFLKEQLLLNAEIVFVDSMEDIKRGFIQFANTALKERNESEVYPLNVEMDITPSLDYLVSANPAFHTYMKGVGWIDNVKEVFQGNAIKERLHIQLKETTSIYAF